jgi:hypothetical protein
VLPEPARRSLEDITASTPDASTPLLAGQVSAHFTIFRLPSGHLGVAFALT